MSVSSNSMALSDLNSIPDLNPHQSITTRKPRRVATISGSMPLQDIRIILGDYDCKDVTRNLDLNKCGTLPVSGGGFGDIYEGAFLDGQKVAIKCPRSFVSWNEGSSQTTKNLAHELYSWSKCKHENVLELLGLAYYKNQIATVSPWMGQGTLPYYISQNPSVNVIDLCCQVSSGVAYLHGRDITHGDIKGVNVLIADDGTVKLADFGNTTLRTYSLQFTGIVDKSALSVRWTAPEVLKGATNVSREADIYALAMEALTGDVPFQGKSETTVLVDVMIRGKIPERLELYFPQGNKRCDALWGMLLRCWDSNSKGRPSAKEVWEHLRSPPP
ncbi:kinase-like domain-containing protein [Rhizoctonia solani]|nr:kinase-like domain-containing protein [Rhizoctonia solani]